ncbi:dihydrofolate reductase family protein [Streptomyces flavofungini]|uniref:Dihydrofolate reductase family protein n=1 Tax=Streptomyces flavofungini TaxID=68200 RepID=A0ABS0WYT5_9ACTN|nr:dihydrofolate reductase family protein [Streptomyces flavofungini]MBJ3806099.1 dihydrofolate reductase family protein [Streptomyces flavofungini]GHC47384.1 deaminase [Streptomyces flavofungini]
MRKLTYFVAVSIDGFIGDPTGDANSFMPFVDEEFLGFLKTEYPETVSATGRKILGFGDGVPNEKFDTVIQGRGSYQLGLDEGEPSPYGHLREYVASHSIGESPSPNVEIITDDLLGKVRALKAEDGELGIWLCGGAQVAGQLIDEVDELVLKTYPVLLGSGMPMFGGVESAVSEFELASSRIFGNGVVVRTYSRKRGKD